MATYSTIKGFTIQSLGADPYTSVAGSGTWASGGALNTGRFPVTGATNAPAVTTGLAFGGTAPGPAKTGATESYDGTSWVEKGDLNDARISLGGAGTATAALGFGGDSPGLPTATESFNGTSWTVVPATLTEGKESAAGFGLQTAAIFATGYVGPPAGPTGNTANVQSYNGTAWTEVFNVNTARSYVYGCGIQTAGIIAGGSAPPYSAAAETWNGTCWTTVNSLNTARANFSMFGTQTDAVGSGGDDGSTPRFAIVEAYDGTSWSEQANLASANKMSGSSGTAGTAGINFGGSDPGNNPMTRTEEWTTAAPPISIAQVGQVWYNTASNVLKGYKLTNGTGAWASAPSSNSVSAEGGGFGGSNTDSVIFRGDPTPVRTQTETFDGTSWTERNDMTTPRTCTIGGSGKTSDGIAMGGCAPPAVLNSTEKWDGTSWSEVNDLNTARKSGGGACYGTSTATLFFGGVTPASPPYSALTEAWDGTCWEVKNTLNAVRRDMTGSIGTQTSAACVGGAGLPHPPTTSVALNETWDGTTWSEKADLNTARYGGMGAGNSNEAMIVTAGNLYPATPPYSALTEQWDGTSWTEVGDLVSGRYRSEGGGTSVSAMTTGGYDPAGAIDAVAQAWTVPQPNEIKTFTSS